jgi:hypothetical protein
MATALRQTEIRSHGTRTYAEPSSGRRVWCCQLAAILNRREQLGQRARHLGGGRLLHCRHDVAAPLERDSNVAVAESRADNLDVDAGLQP